MMKRLCLLLLPFLLTLSAAARERIWEGTACPDKAVTLDAFLPEGTPRAAVIVCPGGSYHWLDEKNEGEAVARWLSGQGIAAYVLRYRVAGKVELVARFRRFSRGNRFPDMLCDLQRSIQLVRERYQGPVGVMGFSAGGHLSMLSAEFFSTNFLAEYGIEPTVPLRPDFVAPIYPVVTFARREVMHRRSCKGIIGPVCQQTDALKDSLSLERHVPEDCPPVFLLNCTDDPIVDYHNSLLLDSALTATGVPHLYVHYATGGHGFGAEPGRQNEETSAWQDTFLAWLDQVLTQEEPYDNGRH